GLFGGDSVTLGQSGSFSDKNAATGKAVTIANSLSGSDAGNYVVAAGSTTADISAATLMVNGTTATNKTYDGTAAATLSGGALAGLVAGDRVSLSQSGSFSDKNVAIGKTVSYTSSLSGSDAGNYLLAASSGTTTADITPAVLSVTANDDSRRADGNAYRGGNGVRYSGFVNGESSGVLGGSLAYGGSAQGATRAGSYGISVNGLSADNYSLAYLDGTLLIDAASTTDPALTEAQQGLQASPPGSELEPSALTALGDERGAVRIHDCGMRLASGQICN
ncbi:MAG TPA: YDG domain-containing protein, partial [Pseudomonas sp.]|nr:YDG domain-containing protein [Pseudomonas sp.]